VEQAHWTQVIRSLRRAQGIGGGLTARHALAEASRLLEDKMLDRTLVEGLIYRSCLLLEYRYTIATHSPEIRRDMVWLDHDKKGMTTLLTQLPRHNSDHSPLTRHATVYTVRADAAGQQGEVVSALQVFKTALEGGTTDLFAVGKYLDTVRFDGGKLLLLRRVVKLDTRMLGIGYHIPF
jgi:methanesulfonate monooxygenase small subunit